MHGSCDEGYKLQQRCAESDVSLQLLPQGPALILGSCCAPTEPQRTRHPFSNQDYSRYVTCWCATRSILMPSASYTSAVLLFSNIHPFSQKHFCHPPSCIFALRRIYICFKNVVLLEKDPISCFDVKYLQSSESSEIPAQIHLTTSLLPRRTGWSELVTPPAGTCCNFDTWYTHVICHKIRASDHLSRRIIRDLRTSKNRKLGQLEKPLGRLFLLSNASRVFLDSVKKSKHPIHIPEIDVAHRQKLVQLKVAFQCGCGLNAGP